MKITQKKIEMIKKVLLLLLLIVFGFFLGSLIFKHDKIDNTDKIDKIDKINVNNNL
jgi:hypothetical protein